MLALGYLSGVIEAAMARGHDQLRLGAFEAGAMDRYYAVGAGCAVASTPISGDGVHRN